MQKQEIAAIIAAKIAGQGTNVDAGSALPEILNGILDLIPEPAPTPTRNVLDLSLLNISSDAGTIPFDTFIAGVRVNGRSVNAGEFFAWLGTCMPGIVSGVGLLSNTELGISTVFVDPAEKYFALTAGGRVPTVQGCEIVLYHVPDTGEVNFSITEV